MNREEWLKAYRSNKQAIWVKVQLTDGSWHFKDSHKGWLEIKKICEDTGESVEWMALQFRSHEVILDDLNGDGIYFIRMVMGFPGAKDRHYYVVGKVKGDLVHKRIFILPELVVDKTYTDHIDDCFEEAIIYAKGKNRKEQV